jgi:hypothetical protein
MSVLHAHPDNGSQRLSSVVRPFSFSARSKVLGFGINEAFSRGLAINLLNNFTNGAQLMSTLSASQSPLVVPLGSSGSTTITWDSGSRNVRVKIFERFNQISPWVPRPLVSPPIKGTYTIALKPGGMYEALMFFEDGIADPNDRHNESPVLAALTVFAILPTPSVLITDGGMRPARRRSLPWRLAGTHLSWMPSANSIFPMHRFSIPA